MRDFDAARAAWARRDEPLTFTLFGETYTCVTVPALGDAFDLIDAPEPVLDDPESQGVKALAGFIRKCLTPESRKQWDQLLRTPDTLQAEDIIVIGTDLAEAFSARPTVPSGRPSSGRRTTGKPRTKRSAPQGTAS